LGERWVRPSGEKRQSLSGDFFHRTSAHIGTV
jgi:hypothetical protein